MNFRKSYWKPISILMLVTAISGCMVGPNFHPPAAPHVERYTAHKLPVKTVSTPGMGKSGKPQKFEVCKNIPSDWWYLFHSRTITQLVEQGIAHSPNLDAAYATLRVAQEAYNAQVGNLLLPAVDAQASAQRQLFSGAQFGTPNTSGNIFNVFNVGVAVSYTLDVFGGSRRTIEGYGAQVDYQQFQLIAAYLTLTSNIVSTAVTIASLEAQIRATKELIYAQSDTLRILKDQFRLGGISKENVLTQETLVDQTIATLPPLQKSLAQNQHALAVLIGSFPNTPMPHINLDSITLPTRLPVSVPSMLVRQRPDIRASEALLHVASANIGVATANLFPQFNLTGNYGWQALVPSRLFGTSTNTWSYMLQITQPLFHGGALLAQRRGAIDAFQQSFAEYRQTVLQGFQNVADSLRALETDARALRAQRTAEIAAAENLKLTQDQYHLGGASYLSLLNAQQQYETVRIARIQAQATRYTDTVALFQALGGGWWNKPWCVKECLYG